MSEKELKPGMNRLLAVLVLLPVAACAAPTQSDAPQGAVPSYLLNSDVTQATISTTICVPGWTKTVRPSSSYTSSLKKAQTAKLPDPDPRHYEEDHRIPLELGGSPREPRNLIPQLWDAAHMKDKDENALRRAVCAGSLTLDAAQRQMWRKWK